MEIIRSGVVKTRKPHRCVGCLGLIPTGTTVRFTVAKDMGQLDTAYYCPVCEEYTGEELECGDTFYEGELRHIDEFWDEIAARFDWERWQWKEASDE